VLLPENEDLKAFAEIVAMLADRGLRVSEKVVLERLGIREAQAGEAVLGHR
jgi:phage gp29-like protein